MAPRHERRRRRLARRWRYDEGGECYQYGGYYSAKVGEIVNERYKIIEKIGYGYFSTVWRCRDLHAFDEGLPTRSLALKIMKSAENFTKAAEAELAIYKSVQRCAKDEDTRICRFVDDFRVSGENGTHLCLVFERLGCSLLNLIDAYRSPDARPCVPTCVVRVIVRDMLTALHFLHARCELLHTDVKPENVLLEHTPPIPGRLLERCKLRFASDPTECPYVLEARNYRRIEVDALSPDEYHELRAKIDHELRARGVSEDEFFGCMSPSTPLSPTGAEFNEFDAREVELPTGVKIPFAPAQWRAKLADLGNAFARTEVRPGMRLQTRQYRAPEVMLGATAGPAADMWSAACVCFELLTGAYLFDIEKRPGGGSSTRHLKLISETLGFRDWRCFAGAPRFAEFFEDDGRLLGAPTLQFYSVEQRLRSDFAFTKEDAATVAAFLAPMLAVDPARRCSAAEAARHTWLADDA